MSVIVAGGIAGDVNHAIKQRLSVIVAGGIAGDVNHAIKQRHGASSVRQSAPNRRHGAISGGNRGCGLFFVEYETGLSRNHPENWQSAIRALIRIRKEGGDRT
ncbi:MAG TPA: hypothetical protein VN702_22185 [Acetobacteraceae bacterium]|nr:hypothetical protein [Acetobacteraceae bacterium]